ncbi:MFS transporter [Paractinoplanes rishiriensis]|uniref:MFS transporter n=1 Tax=Paractinoplanes rishiriensis TaxID=1050105 RepID=A0A919K2U6_9ACTN|nr:MFS transporter [Actinoplanes rishiriensis]GIE98459.1 MFS transporter [Actinoplanes rishiriensis]
MRAGAREWAGLAVLSLPCLLVSLDAEVLNLAAPQVTAALHPTSVELLWIMDSYVFVVAGALIAMGVLGDRVGRRRLLLAGAACFGLSSLLAAFATSPGELIAARVLMGLSGASLMPSTLALIRVMFDDSRQRAAALGVWSASFSLGGVASPLVGGVLLTHFWWGSVFLLAVPAVLVLLAIGPAVLPESRDRGATSFDFLGALSCMAAVLLFVYGLKRLAAEGWHPLPPAAMLLAVLLGVLFVRRQRRLRQPLLDLTIFREARVSVALISNALSYFVLYGTQLAIALYLQLGMGLSPLAAGLWTLPSVLAYLGSSFLGPALARRFPVGPVIAAGLAVMAAGFAILALGGLPAVVTGMVIFSVGLAPVYILTTELVVVTVRAARAGMAAAVTETGCELGGALGIAVLGSLSVAAFRHGMAGYDLPPGATLTDVMSAAGALPPHLAEVMLQRAEVAYGTAFALMSVTAAVLVAGAAVLAAVVLRPERPGAVRAALPAGRRAVQAALPAGRAVQAALPAGRRAVPGQRAGAVAVPAAPCPGWPGAGRDGPAAGAR